MDQINFKALREINPDPIRFSSQVRSRLRIMAHRISAGYLQSINYAFQLRYTDTILLYIENLDFKPIDNNAFFSLGNEKTPCGATKVFISEKHLLSLQDEGKRNLTVKTIHEGLIKFAKETNHETELLEKAYKQFLSRDYFGSHYKEYQSNNKKYTCQIQSRENWGSANYRLLVKYHESSEARVFEITKKDYPFFDEMPGITQRDILDYPQTFYPIKWEGKNFIMYWGKEKYIFDPAKEQVIREE
jgi:hypothetical protein